MVLENLVVQIKDHGVIVFQLEVGWFKAEDVFLLLTKVVEEIRRKADDRKS